MLKIFDNIAKNENLIIFIHGFIGGESTWVKHDDTKPFIDSVFNDLEVSKHYDSGVFSYHTELIKLFPKGRRMLNKIVNKKKSTKNLPIDDLGELLGTQVKYKCQEYSNLVLVGHSMGGLVAKRFLLNDLKKNEVSKVGMYVSLATPHLGSHLATFGNRIIQNFQLEDLDPLSDNIRNLNEEWIKCKILPEKRIYFQGKSDEIVPRQSSIALDRDNIEPNYSDDDHFSIIIPDCDDDIVVFALQTELKELYLSKKKVKS